MSERPKVQAIKLQPSDVQDTLELDRRDRWDYDERERALTELEEQHVIQVREGGLEAAKAEGYAWKHYPPGRKGKELREKDAKAIRQRAEGRMEKVRFIFGPRGSGKTLECTYEAGLMYRAGCEVVSNLGLLFGRMATDARAFLHIGTSPPDVWWVEDECHQGRSKWRQQSAANIRSGDMIAAMRKQECGYVGLTSQPQQLGMDSYSLAEWLTYMQETARPGPASGQITMALIRSLPKRAASDWARTWGITLGPRPYDHKDALATQWGIPTRAKEPGLNLLMSPPPGLRWASKLYGSFVGIPARATTAAALSAKDVYAIDDSGTWDWGELTEEEEAEAAAESQAAELEQRLNTMTLTEQRALLVEQTLECIAQQWVKEGKDGKMSVRELLEAIEQHFGLRWPQGIAGATFSPFGLSRGRFLPDLLLMSVEDLNAL